MSVIVCKAAVAYEPGEHLRIVDLEVAPPQAGEVRLKVVASAVSHTDLFAFNGSNADAKFPCILGHEAGCVVESVGEGVTSVVPGDHVIPCYIPQCRELECIFCSSSKSNLCPKLIATQKEGVMSDGTTRFSVNGEPIYHFMGCSTFSEYTVVSEISCVKVSNNCQLAKACVFGGEITSGLGAVWNTCDVKEGSTVGVWGLSAEGLAVIQACKSRGCSRIFAIDINARKFDAAQKLGATDCVNSNDLESEGVTVESHILSEVPWGLDFTFDVTGHVDNIQIALECSHRGWGVCCVLGDSLPGHQISTKPSDVIDGRVLKGSSMGGFKTRDEIPGLVDSYMNGELPIDQYFTHQYNGVTVGVKAAMDSMHSSTCIKAVVKF